MNWIAVAAVYGGLAVVAGAFGAHGLRARLDPSQLSAWNTAAQYQLIHSLVLLALGLFHSQTGRSVTLQASLFAVGILFFSGSIYLLTLTPMRWLGPITPLGGLLMIGGWGSLIALARS